MWRHLTVNDLEKAHSSEINAPFSRSRTLNISLSGKKINEVTAWECLECFLDLRRAQEDISEEDEVKEKPSSTLASSHAQLSRKG